MEASGGVTVVGSDAPSEYHVAPRTDNQTPTIGSDIVVYSVAAGDRFHIGEACKSEAS